MIVNPIVSERYAFVCDVGSPCSALARAWPELDFSHIENIWWPAVEESAEGNMMVASLADSYDGLIYFEKSEAAKGLD